MGTFVSLLELRIIFDDNLKTTSIYFLLQTLNYSAVNLIAFYLNYYIEPFCIDKN